MNTFVSGAAATQDVSFADSISTSHSNPTYCGPKTYSFSPTLSFLSVSGTTLFLITTNPNDVSVNTVTITVSLTNYPAIASVSATFQATVLC